MENKARLKKIICMLIMTFVTFCTFAKDQTPEFLSLEQNGYFIDDLFIDAINVFRGFFYYYNTIARLLALFFLMITLIWSSFKLWFGTIDIRKVVVDVVCKVCLYSVLIVVYPSIVSGVLSTAIQLGEASVNGNTIMITGIGSIIDSVEHTVTKSGEILDKELSKSKYSTLSDKDLEFIASYYFCTPEEAKAKVENLWGTKITIDNTYNQLIGNTSTVIASSGVLAAGLVTGAVGSALGGGAGGIPGFVMSSAGILSLSSVVNNFFNKTDSQKAMTENVKKLKNQQSLKNEVNSAYKNIVAFANLFADNEEDKFDENGKLNKESLIKRWSELKPKLNDYIQAPYIESSENFYGIQLLSPARMVKYSVLVARLIFNKCSTSIICSDKKGIVIKWKEIGKTFVNIIQFLILLIILAVNIVTTVFIVVDYCVCIIEYYIVTGIGVIFVPCLLFDATKSYASNLIRLFISYLFKLIVTISVLYYSYVMYLKVALRMLYEDDPNSWINLCWMLIMALLIKSLQGAIPQIASAVTTGQPSLNLGNVLQAAQSSVRGVRTAGHMTRSAAHGAAKLIKTPLEALGGAGAFGIRQWRNQESINKAAGVAGDKAMNNFLTNKGKTFDQLSTEEKTEALQAKHDAASAFKKDVHSKQWQGKKQEIADFLTFGKKGTSGMDGFAKDVSYKAGKKDRDGRQSSQSKFDESLLSYAGNFGDFMVPPSKSDKNESDGIDANQVNDNESNKNKE